MLDEENDSSSSDNFTFCVENKIISKGDLQRIEIVDLQLKEVVWLSEFPFSIFHFSQSTKFSLRLKKINVLFEGFMNTNHKLICERYQYDNNLFLNTLSFNFIKFT